MLTQDQQDKIINSEWVINSVLNKLGCLGNEDLKQSAWMYMCQCIQRFDSTKDVKWTTFAYKNILLYIKRMRSEQRKKDNMIIDEDAYDLVETYDIEENVSHETMQKLRNLYEVCNDDERRYMDLKVAGYKNHEVRVIAGWGKRKLYKNIKRIKEKAQEQIRQELI